MRSFFAVAGSCVMGSETKMASHRNYRKHGTFRCTKFETRIRSQVETQIWSQLETQIRSQDTPRPTYSDGGRKLNHQPYTLYRALMVQTRGVKNSKMLERKKSVYARTSDSLSLAWPSIDGAEYLKNWSRRTIGPT